LPTQCRSFFHLPGHTKALIANDPNQAQQRGYSQPGEEKTWYLESVKNGGPAPKYSDSRESIDIGHISDTLFPNKWVPDHVHSGQHRQIMERLYEECSVLSTRLLECLAMACGVDRDTFTSRCTNTASVLRSNNYPPVATELLDTGAIGRAWPHCDFGIISLVFPGAISGLEYALRSGPKTGCFEPVGFSSSSDIVLQVAETLQRWSNDTLTACLHRVQKPRADELMEGGMAPERTSMVFFCKADREARVGPLSVFVGKGEQARYPDLTALEYQEERNSAHYPG